MMIADAMRVRYDTEANPKDEVLDLSDPAQLQKLMNMAQ